MLVIGSVVLRISGLEQSAVACELEVIHWTRNRGRRTGWGCPTLNDLHLAATRHCRELLGNYGFAAASAMLSTCHYNPCNCYLCPS